LVIAVTGATGFIGRRLVDVLVARGDAAVRVLVRNNDAIARTGFRGEAMEGDMRNPAAFARIFEVISAYFAALVLDPALAALRPRSMAKAHLYCAQLHARAERYRAALSNTAIAHRLFPATLVRPETWRSVANALFGRAAHSLIWWLLKISGPKA